MCTLTWCATPTGYEVVFNRDERRTRPQAEPPVRTEVEGVAYLAPTDREAGGTWLTVNEHGVVHALLNAYGLGRGWESPAAGRRSRGQLVRDLAMSSGVVETLEHLERADLSVYPPFTIAAFDGVARPEGRSPAVWSWDGRDLLTVPTGDLPILSSSAFETEPVIEARRRALAEVLAKTDDRSTQPTTDGALQDPASRRLDFHRSHLEQGREWSPCMHREISVTVSLSWIRVSGRGATFHYAEGSPCERGSFVSAQIALRSGTHDTAQPDASSAVTLPRAETDEVARAG